MKKNVLILLTVFMSYTLMAQQKQKEVGVIFTGLHSFGMSYKTGTNKALWRFNTLFISGSNIDRTTVGNNSNKKQFGFGVKIGKEYRKAISKNFEFRFGADLAFDYSYEKDEQNNNISTRTLYHPGVNLVFGFNYLLSNNFSIGAELLPNFTYTTGETASNNNGRGRVTAISGYDYGISNNSVLFCLAYKF